MEELDQTIMTIFDREFEKAKSRIWEKVEDLVYEADGEEVDSETLLPYYLFYYKLLSNQLEGYGVISKDIPIPQHNAIRWV